MRSRGAIWLILVGGLLDLPEAPVDHPEAYFAAMEVRWSPAGVRLALDDGVDEQMVLDAARTAGRVMRFGFDERSLVDLYRESVGDEE